MPIHPTPSPPYAGFRSYGLFLVLLALNILNFVDRTLPQALVVDITEDLELSYTTFTLISGPLFGLTYACAGLFLGALADRMHRPRLIAAAVAVWSLMTAATGLSRSVGEFAVTRAMVAVGEAGLSPAGLSMLATVFSPERRGTVTSLYYLGISIGAGASYFIAGSLGATLGWRQCFLILGAVGLCLSLLVAFLAEPGGRAVDHHPGTRQAFAVALGDVAGVLRRSAALRWTLLAAILILFSQGASVLDQAWLVREAGLKKAEAQTLVGLLFTIGSVAGALVGGPLADFVARRIVGGRLVYAIGVLAILTPLALTIRFLEPQSPLFLAAMLMGSAGFTLFYGALIPSVQDLAPASVRATVIAVTLLAMAMLGTALGNLCAGVLADRFAAMDVAMPIRAASVATNAVALLAFPCLFMAWRRYGRDRALHGSRD